MRAVITAGCSSLGELVIAHYLLYYIMVLLSFSSSFEYSVQPFTLVLVGNNQEITIVYLSWFRDAYPEQPD